jgi:hypothetical protein
MLIHRYFANLKKYTAVLKDNEIGLQKYSSQRKEAVDFAMWWWRPDLKCSSKVETRHFEINRRKSSLD